MKNLKTIGIIAGTVILLLLFVTQCKSTIITSLGGYVEKEQTVQVDTVYGTPNIDTLSVFNHYVETRGIILNPEPIIKYVAVKEDKTQKTDSTKLFNVAIKDSLIDGTLSIENYFNGNVKNADFRYKPLFPKYITKEVPVYITKTVTETLSSPDRTRIGVGLGINSEVAPSANINILTKKYWDFEVNYTKPDLIDSNTLLPNDIVGIKITKYF